MSWKPNKKFKNWFRIFGIFDEVLPNDMNDFYIIFRIAWRAYRFGYREGKKGQK